MTDLAPRTDPAERQVSALVVDDEALIRWSVAETLTTMGIAVVQASDAASAIDRIKNAATPFDVVVLDLRLPDMNDLTLLRQVRQLLSGAFVLLMTAFGTPEIMAEATAIGANAILVKPFELEKLTELVSRRSGPNP